MLPESITTVQVTAQYGSADGSAASGTVSFTPSVLTAGAGFLLGSPLQVSLDVHGRLRVDLAATDDPAWSPAGFTYAVLERITGRRPRTYEIEVPVAAAGTGLDLASVAPGPAAAVTVQDCRDYAGDALAGWSDTEIGRALAAERAAQARVCRVPDPMPVELEEALMRRVLRNLALRLLPLAVAQGDAESGPIRAPMRDPEIRRLEAGYPRLTVR